MNKINRNDLLQAIARGWCSKLNEHKTMDSELALAIAMEVWTLLTAQQPPEQPAAPMNCRDAGPGKGLCDYCAQGEYEKCRYMPQPAPQSPAHAERVKICKTLILSGYKPDWPYTTLFDDGGMAWAEARDILTAEGKL